MLFLSAGMEKAGTAWWYNLHNDLLMAAGHPDARLVRESHGLESILHDGNCRLDRLDDRSMRRLVAVAENGGTFVAKTHRGPTRVVRELQASGHLKTSYICRDLRDVMVSAMDAGAQMRQNGDASRFFGFGPYRSFARIKTPRGATLWARYQLMSRWRDWMGCEGTLVTRYEDLLADTMGQVGRLAAHLEVDVSDETMREIVASYRRETQEVDQGGKLHFNKGITGRYKDVLSVNDQDRAKRQLNEYLVKMDYLD